MSKSMLFLRKMDRVKNRVAKVAREHNWHPPKSLDSDKIFRPNILYCVAN